MILVKKLKFYLCLFFDIQGMKIKFDHYLVQKQPMILIKKNRDFMFDGHLVREQACLDYKIYKFYIDTIVDLFPLRLF